MPKIQIAQYSQFVDVRTGVAFTPVSDRRTGQYIGIADVDEAEALAFASRPNFHVLTNTEYLAMTSPPVAAPSAPVNPAAIPQAPQPPADSARKK
jgi:hypothetical protein